MRPNRAIILALAAFVAGTAAPAAAFAQEPAGDGIESVSPRVLFVVSGGYWQGEVTPLSPPPSATANGTDAADTPAEASAPDPAPASAGEPGPADAPATAKAEPARGFYRLVVIRSNDNTSRLHLQRFALSPEGPTLVDGRELQEISSLPAYVTDARSEDTSNVTNQAGFAAFITLKTDPTVVERETWTVFVDEFGEVEVTRATN